MAARVGLGRVRSGLCRSAHTGRCDLPPSGVAFTGLGDGEDWRSALFYGGVDPAARRDESARKVHGWSALSSRSIPNLQKSGLPLEVVSWSVKEVAKFLGALGLAEWTEVFLTHRIQGDVMFSLTEVTLAEMGVSKIGDRLYLHDCLQSLYEELTAWKQAKEKQLRYGQGAKQKVAVPALPGGAGSAAAPTAGYGGGGGGGGYAGGGGGGGGGGAGGKGKALLQQMVNQGYTVEEIMGRKGAARAREAALLLRERSALLLRG